MIELEKRVIKEYYNIYEDDFMNDEAERMGWVLADLHRDDKLTDEEYEYLRHENERGDLI